MRKFMLWLCAALLFASSLQASSAASAMAGTGRHCAYRLDPIPRTPSGIVRARLVLIGCFGTFPEAIQMGSGGSIDLPSGTTPTSLTERQLEAHTTPGRASVLIGTEFNLSSFGGASNDYFAASTCTAATTWAVPNVTATWNDMFESGKGFGGCHTNRKYRNTGFGGAMVACTPNCSDYGALDNQVSSLRWRF